MSTIKADTIVASDGSSPVTLTKQEAAKAYVLFDQGVPEIDNSFNTSSLTDSSTGNGDVNWTNAMSNAVYITVACTGTVSFSAAYNVSLADDTSSGNPRTTSKFYFVSNYGNASTTLFVDNGQNQLAILGDLA